AVRPSTVPPPNDERATTNDERRPCSPIEIRNLPHRAFFYNAPHTMNDHEIMLSRILNAKLVSILVFASGLASAQAIPKAVDDRITAAQSAGDNAWMLVSAAL